MRYSLALLVAAIAVHASPVPVPQAVTQKISPTAPMPSGCMVSYSGSFGIAAMNMTSAKAPVTTLPDGQPQAGTSTLAASVTQKSDGQVVATSVAPVSQISDGQPQATTKPAITQIGDGQVQAPTAHAITQIGDGQIQAPTAPAVSQIGDGQVQKPTGTAVSQIGDGQPQAATGKAVSQISDGQPQAATGTAVTQKSDGQPQAATGTAVSQKSDGQPQATTAPTPGYVTCQTNSTLVMTLSGGVLKDSQGRTGYIASNYQFQFDDPPQAGALYTSGFSICSNGSVALGGSYIFYQCLSGNFYNLYDRNWAAQCSPVTIDMLSLKTC